MTVRLYIDPETDAPHIWRHAVEEQEVLTSWGVRSRTVPDATGPGLRLAVPGAEDTFA